MNNQLLNGRKVYVPMLRVDTVELGLEKSRFSNEARRVYACAYTLEKMLFSLGGIKVQGLKYEPTLNRYPDVNLQGDNAKYRIDAATDALAGHAPLTFLFEGNLQSIACISYVSRPVNEIRVASTPGLNIPVDYAYLSRVFVMKRKEDGSGFFYKKDLPTLAVAKDNLKSSNALFRTIENLRNEGIKDIVLLAHHFASRRIAKTESSNLVHESETSLSNLEQAFPDVTFYPMQSDIVSAVNINGKSTIGRIYEVPHHQFHAVQLDEDIQKQSLPIYSISTLRTVGVSTQSGLCTYFYMFSNQNDAMNNEKRIRTHHLMIDPSDTDQMKAVRSILRGMHYFEAEKPFVGSKRQFYAPVLDHSHASDGANVQSMGEVIISDRQYRGEVIMCLPSLLSKLESYDLDKTQIEIKSTEATILIENSAASQQGVQEP